MRRFLGSILLLALAAPARSLSNLAVTVRNSAGAPIQGAGVVALSFSNGRPNSRISVLGLTDAAGSLSFDGSGFTPGFTSTLTAGNFYQIVASSHGFLPDLIDQFAGSPATINAAVPSAAPPAVNIVISSAGVTGLRVISASLINATTGTLVFGQLALKTGGGACAYGIASIDNTGSGAMQFVNVTTAPANVYQYSAFDPVKNRSAGASVNVALTTHTILNGSTLDFATARAPVANIGQAQTGGQGGGLSVYGVVTDTASAAIAYLQLNFQSQHTDSYGQTVNDWRGAQTDQNGVFQLYDLRPGNTYYAEIYGGCNPATGLCYQGWRSPTAPNGAPSTNDFFYASTASVINPNIVLNQMPPGNGTLAVYVRDQYGNPFFQAGIGLFPDGRPWQTAPATPCTGPFASNPGFKTLNAQASTGYYLLTGLPSGNYELSAWTPYGGTSFNGGPDGEQNYGPCSASGTGADDVRLTIDTTTVGMGWVYGISGTVLYSGVSSVTVTVRIATGTLNGVIKGAMTFPSVVDLSASPISIVLYPNCSGGESCEGGGFAAFSSVS
ncbi:MAG: hypothetical protein AAB262_06435, partial [Elusimicrobiota bacterium]